MFEASDYQKMEEWIPEKFLRRDLSPNTFITIPLSQEEVKVAEGVLQRPILPENIPMVQVKMGVYDLKSDKTHIQSFYRRVNPQDEETQKLVMSGFDVVERATIDTRFLERPPLDTEMLRSCFKEIFQELQSHPHLKGKVIRSISPWLDLERKWGAEVTLEMAFKILETQDIETLIRSYRIHIEKSINTNPNLKYITYDLVNTPPNNFPKLQDIHHLTCSQEVPKNEEDELKHEKNGFHISEHKVYLEGNIPVQDISMKINLREPTLIEAQQEILDYLGITMQ